MKTRTSLEMTYPNLIAGRWADGPHRFENRNPADTRDLVGQFVHGTAADMTAAVEAAHAAFPGWAKMPAPARGSYLFRAAEILDGRFDQVAAEMTREEGKTLPEAKGEAAPSTSSGTSEARAPAFPVSRRRRNGSVSSPSPSGSPSASWVS